ncbi:MAG: hypothetical protein M3P26_18090 [Gemmatimonadota bacterium]|nr:hypothetical protein [Gemmatimonadota bacterium]
MADRSARAPGPDAVGDCDWARVALEHSAKMMLARNTGVLATIRVVLISST